MLSPTANLVPSPTEQLDREGGALESGIHERPQTFSPAELMLSAFLDAAAPIAVESPSGVLLCANTALEQLLGVRAERLIGESLALALCEQDQLRFLALREKCLGGEDQVGVEFTVSDAQRREHVMLLTASLLTDVDGEALAISYHFQDVGMLKARLRESDRALAKVEAISKAEKARLELSREQVTRAEARVQLLESLLMAQQRIHQELASGFGTDIAVGRVLGIVCSVGGFRAGEFWRGEVCEGRAQAFRRAEFVAGEASAALGALAPEEGLCMPLEGESKSWGGREQQHLLTQLRAKAALATSLSRMVLVEVRTEEVWFGVLRLLGGEAPAESSTLSRMLEETGLRLGDYLAHGEWLQKGRRFLVNPPRTDY